MPPPGFLRLKVTAVRALAVEVAILGSEFTSLDLFVTERFLHIVKPPPPTRRSAHQKSLTNYRTGVYTEFLKKVHLTFGKKDQIFPRLFSRKSIFSFTFLEKPP